jgi:hypothetical protein
MKVLIITILPLFFVVITLTEEYGQSNCENRVEESWRKLNNNIS